MPYSMEFMEKTLRKTLRKYKEPTLTKPRSVLVSLQITKLSYASTGILLSHKSYNFNKHTTHNNSTTNLL